MLNKLVAGLVLASLALAPAAAQVNLNLNGPQPTIDTTNTAIDPATKQGQASQLTAQQAIQGSTAAVAGTVAPDGAPSTTTQTVQPSPSSKFDTIVKGATNIWSAVIGFTASAAAAASASTSLPLTVTSAFTNQAAVVSGIPIAGQIASGSGIPAGTTIVGVTNNGSGSFTVILSQAVTVASGAAVTSGGPQQVLPIELARRGFSRQNQGTGNCWFNGMGNATTDANSRLLPALSSYDSLATHVSTGAQADICAVPATPEFVRSW